MKATSSRRGSAPTRDRLLAAAERVLITRGASALTLDAVAADAGVSKGGLLYHFPTKDALASALVEQAVARVDRALAAATVDDESPGAFTRAYIAVTMGEPDRPDASTESLSRALLGALTLDPGLLDPLRAAYGRWQQRLEGDGLPDGAATLVRLAMDGWWTGAVLDLPALSPSAESALRDQLSHLAQTPPPVNRS